MRGLDGALRRGRTAEQQRQRDTCRITRPGEGKGPFNSETGQYDPPEPVVVYEGPCRIPRRENMVGSVSAAGEASWQVGEYPLNLPLVGSGYVAGEEVKTGQIVTYLTSPDDPTLVGNVYTISDSADHSQATARRFRMKRVTGVR